MNPLKTAVIGVGALGRHHARILSGMEGVSLVAVADPDETRGRAIARDCRTRWTADFRTLLQEPTTLDAAVVAVPTALHRLVAGELIRRSVPVLVEKPLAAGLDDARTLVRLAREHRLPLQVGHVERFNPAWRTARDHCGPPKYIRAERLSPYAFRSMDIGAVHDLMIHDIDLILSLVPARPVHVSAFGLSLVGGREDCVQARLTFEDGCIADLTANRVCPATRRSIQVWSETGCVEADLHHRRVTAYRPGPALRHGPLPFDLARSPGADMDALKARMFGNVDQADSREPAGTAGPFFEVISPPVPEGDAHTKELAAFVHAVQTNGTPEVDGTQAVRALEVADRILSCVAIHRWDGAHGDRMGPHAHTIHTPLHDRAAA